MNSSAGLCQKHCGLTGRVGAADDDDLIVGAELRILHEGRVVVDADTFKLTQICERRLTVAAPVAMITARAGIVAPSSSFTP